MSRARDTKEAFLAAGRRLFEGQGFDQATVAAICAAAGASNGSFFHFFGSKEGLATALFLDAIRVYHNAMLASLAGGPGAVEGVRALVGAHLDWVVMQRAEARFLFEQSRPEWLASIRREQRDENARFAAGIEAWRGPLVAAGALRPMDVLLFVSQIVGPAQIFCRAFLSGREEADPRAYREDLCACAVRAVVSEVVASGAAESKAAAARIPDARIR